MRLNVQCTSSLKWEVQDNRSIWASLKFTVERYLTSLTVRKNWLYKKMPTERFKSQAWKNVSQQTKRKCCRSSISVTVSALHTALPPMTLQVDRTLSARSEWEMRQTRVSESCWSLIWLGPKEHKTPNQTTVNVDLKVLKSTRVSWLWKSASVPSTPNQVTFLSEHQSWQWCWEIPSSINNHQKL